MHRTAMMMAGERKFRDFRKDNKLDTRQFQMAFRTLRQLSAQERSAEKELDVDATIHDTCESAGRLEVRYKNPRKNTVKVLLLMDSGGSMDYYSGLCSQLFQAATKSNHLKSCTPTISITAFTATFTTASASGGTAKRLRNGFCRISTPAIRSSSWATPP